MFVLVLHVSGSYTIADFNIVSLVTYYYILFDLYVVAIAVKALYVPIFDYPAANM